MGCLNSEGRFGHWFGNIHLSGPCNRACYFCIGQHMMGLDALNTLATWPLEHLEQFVDACRAKGITEVNVTGTNTDPLLYQYTAELKDYLKQRIPTLLFGVRTNGVAVGAHPDRWALYDKGSVTICSCDPGVYRRMMGSGTPPDLVRIRQLSAQFSSLKINVVLGPENVETGDVFRTLSVLNTLGYTRVNLREPYGQPHVGDPCARKGWRPARYYYGMPCYRYQDMEVTYWDVHYVEVESVNLYANGVVSDTYPITQGYDPEAGQVQDQQQFSGGRVRAQWIGKGTQRTEGTMK